MDGYGSWREVGSGVYVRRHESFDLNVGLVVGDDACLVIDTRRSHREARDLIEAIGRVTPHPWTVANTHHHFDHVFGNDAFRPAEVWGHQMCAERIREYGETQRQVMIARARSAGMDELVDELADVRVDPPDRTFTEVAVLVVGGRRIELRHLGAGHTDSDIVLAVPDAGVVFAGDLVEEGAPPSFADSFPLDWPAALRRLLPMIDGPVVPGHGDMVDREFVRRQAEDIDRTARIAREAHAEGRGIDEAVVEVPFPAEHARDALSRAYRQLDGAPAYDPPDVVLRAAGL